MTIDAGEALGFKHWKRFQAERFRMRSLLGVRSWRFWPKTLSFGRASKAFHGLQMLSLALSIGLQISLDLQGT